MNALSIDCPICAARAGEQCAPMSLTQPHLARKEEAEDLSRDIERATEPKAVVIPIRRRMRDWGQM